MSAARALGGAAGLAAALGLALAATAVRAADDAERDPRAVEAVERMAARIAGAQKLRVRGEIAWDVVQADGRTLEFGATREITLQRPDRLRVDLRLREGGERRLLYDGSRFVLHDLEHGVYASAARQGAVDDVVAWAGRELGIPVALAELLSPDLPVLLDQFTESAAWVGEPTIDGVPCDHVSLRLAIGGMQLWIGQEDGLPRRITISYEREEGRPQFRARFEGWDLSPRAKDSTFAFEPPKGAERVAFARRGPAPAEDAK